MSASNAFETLILEHIFQNANIANIGDATGLRGSSSAGNLYVSLHTADPGETGTAVSSETAYGGPYARQAVVRDNTGWTVSGDTATNAAAITFPLCTGTPGSDITHVGVVTSSSGAGTLLCSLQLSSPITMSAGAQPAFGAGDLDFTAA